MEFPKRTEYSDYFHTYINHLPTGELIELLEKTQDYTLSIVEKISADLYDYQYEEGKWTIKEVLLHIIDCEQIMSYRALRFARKDYASALSFDENTYAIAPDTKNMDWTYLLDSMKLLRAYTVHFFKGLTAEEGERGGSEAFPNSVRAIAAIIAGHQLHHIYVLQERYLGQTVQLFEL